VRILLLTLYFEPDVAANAVIMTKLAEELVRLGHHMTVVTAFPHYAGNVIEETYQGRLIERESRKGVEIIRTYLYASPEKQRFLVRFLNYVSFNCLSTLAGLLCGPQDVILAPSPPLTVGFSAYIIGLFRRIPYIYNVQDIYPDVVVKLGILSSRWVIAVSRWLERFVYKHARHITVVSEGFQANLLRKDVPQARLTIIPNFVDTDFVRPLPRDNSFRQRLGLDHRPMVLYAGNLGHSQDIEVVLQCAALLEGQDDIAFVIVGEGSCKADLESLARDMALSNVRFVPFQPREDVPEIYAAADVSLVPLKQGIALNSVPSKAYTIMASGRPIVASVDRDSDAWQLVKRAECGVCVPPEDAKALAHAVHALCLDADLRGRLGRNGRRYVVQHYTPGAIAGRYDALLRRVVDRWV
jgi:colanic acid biosynthesis glycosyl transferase WcaI